MSKDILIHPKTDLILQKLGTQLGGKAVIFVGKKGIGKTYLVQNHVAEVLGINKYSNPLHNPAVLYIEADDKAFGIDDSRMVSQFLKTKGTTKTGVERVVFLEQIDTMTTEAQNALLKTLEEIPSSSLIVLSASNTAFLKPTVLSRVIQVRVLPITQADAIQYFTAMGFKEPDISKYFMISGGAPGLMHRLLSEQDETYLTGFELAKAFLSATTFDRLCMVDTLSKQKESITYFFDGIKKISNVSIQKHSSEQLQSSALERWLQILSNTMQSERSIQKNANVKLALTTLALKI